MAVVSAASRCIATSCAHTLVCIGRFFQTPCFRALVKVPPPGQNPQAPPPTQILPDDLTPGIVCRPIINIAGEPRS
jgi:hypothetical protein